MIICCFLLISFAKDEMFQLGSRLISFLWVLNSLLDNFYDFIYYKLLIEIIRVNHFWQEEKNIL